jgi:hypothetical protein
MLAERCRSPVPSCCHGPHVPVTPQRFGHLHLPRLRSLSARAKRESRCWRSWCSRGPWRPLSHLERALSASVSGAGRRAHVSSPRVKRAPSAAPPSRGPRWAEMVTPAVGADGLPRRDRPALSQAPGLTRLPQAIGHGDETAGFQHGPLVAPSPCVPVERAEPVRGLGAACGRPHIPGVQPDRASRPTGVGRLYGAQRSDAHAWPRRSGPITASHAAPLA